MKNQPAKVQSPLLIPAILVGVAMLIVLVLYIGNRKNPQIATSPTPSPSITITTSPSPSAVASPSATSTLTPTPSLSPTPSPTLNTTTTTYTNTAYGFQASVPAGYKVVDQVQDNGLQKSDRTVLITNDQSITSIAPGHCLPGFMFSVITPSTPFSTLAKKESWNFLDNISITQGTVNALPSIEITGTYNQQYVYYTPNTNVKISLLNLDSSFLELSSCSTGGSVDNGTYNSIENSIDKIGE